jgi:transketolase
MQIIVPGTAREFEALFRQAYAAGSPTYYRLGRQTNVHDQQVEFGRLAVVKRGQAGTVIAVGPLLSATLQAVADLDVSLLYCTTLAPFDGETLRQECVGTKIVLVEPYYAGGLTADIMVAMGRRPVCIEAIGVPREVFHQYGKPEQLDEAFGLTPAGIRARIVEFLADESSAGQPEIG